jgi:pimeloyl-ACP methyl ester carboxylesterase
MIITRHGLHSSRNGTITGINDELNARIVDHNTAMLSFDARGHGESAEKNKDMQRVHPITDEAQDFIDLIDHYNKTHGIEKFSIIGHSRGGTAAAIAQTLDPRIKNVVMICSPPQMTVPRQVRGALLKKQLLKEFRQGTDVLTTNQRGDTFIVNINSFFTDPDHIETIEYRRRPVEIDDVLLRHLKDHPLKADQKLYVIHSPEDSQVKAFRVEDFQNKVGKAGIRNVEFYTGIGGQPTVIKGDDHRLKDQANITAVVEKCVELLRP